MMEIRDECETGWPSEVNLRQRIAAYTRDDRLRNYGLPAKLKAKVQGEPLLRYKVGKTANPPIRAAQYGATYDEMILVYKTSSPDHAARLETIMTRTSRMLITSAMGAEGGEQQKAPITCTLSFVGRQADLRGSSSISRSERSGAVQGGRH
jgi:hypothetical protein